MAGGFPRSQSGGRTLPSDRPHRIGREPTRGERRAARPSGANPHDRILTIVAAGSRPKPFAFFACPIEGAIAHALFRKAVKSRSGRSIHGGGQGRNRTTDTRIFSPLLYRLSYLAFIRVHRIHRTRWLFYIRRRNRQGESAFSAMRASKSSRKKPARSLFSPILILGIDPRRRGCFLS